EPARRLARGQEPVRGVLAREPHRVAWNHLRREQAHESDRVAPRLVEGGHVLEPPEPPRDEPGLLAHLAPRPRHRPLAAPERAGHRLPHPRQRASRAPLEGEELRPAAAPPEYVD